MSLGRTVDWSRGVLDASNEELKALTDVVRNLFDRVIEVPTQVRYPLLDYKKELGRASALTAPLYERRQILAALPAELSVPFLRAGLKAL